jgi:hypothetical protein
MVPETWALIGRGTRDGLPMVQVAREKRDPDVKLTIWTLVQRANGSWYSIGQWISRGEYREFDQPQKLTDSYIDMRLKDLAND